MNLFTLRQSNERPAQCVPHAQCILIVRQTPRSVPTLSQFREGLSGAKQLWAESQACLYICLAGHLRWHILTHEWKEEWHE